MKKAPLVVRLKIYAIAAAAIAAIAGIWWLYAQLKSTELSVENDKSIDITPEQISSIKAIGEWEFLSVANEEIVDTVRKGIFTDDHLVRIYYGTLRLGINLHKAKPGWIKASGDTVTVTLPGVELLDHDFIDEARTKSFYQSGKWPPAAREALYRKAYQRMVSHSLTPENIAAAEQNADTQVRNMLRAMGFDNVVIHFEK